MYSGEGRQLLVTVLNADLTAFDITMCDGLILALYYEPFELVQQYSMVVTAGYSTMTIQGAGNNEILVDIDAGNTKLVRDKTLYAAGKCDINGVPLEFKAKIEIVEDHPLRLVTVPV